MFAAGEPFGRSRPLASWPVLADGGARRTRGERFDRVSRERPQSRFAASVQEKESQSAFVAEAVFGWVFGLVVPAALAEAVHASTIRLEAAGARKDRNVTAIIPIGLLAATIIALSTVFGGAIVGVILGGLVVVGAFAWFLALGTSKTTRAQTITPATTSTET